MKFLFLGIDGGDWEIFDQYEMPFLRLLKEENVCLDLEEDLHSRGWVEVISGEHASNNNGFYLRPKLDGTRDFTFSYSFSDLIENKNQRLIWELPNKSSNRIGVMNIPTTYPAPRDVNGFFVSGAGGGLTKVDGIPDEMCSDAWVQGQLTKSNYQLDLRLKPSGIADSRKLMADLTKMMVNRMTTFIELSTEREIDYGFIVLRAPTVVTYAAMYEIANKESKDWDEMLSNFFSELDNSLKNLFSQLSPKEFIIASDHGCVPQKYLSNFNVALEDLGYLHYLRKPSDHFKYYKGLLKRKVKSQLGRLHYPEPDYSIDFSSTSIFGKFYYNGLYLNDERFNGIVKSADAERIVKEFCEKFNESDYSSRFRMVAKPYRSLNSDAKFERELPDIWIEAPDDIYFLGNGRKFVDDNPSYRSLKLDLSDAPSSMLTGIKGKIPVCLISKSLEQFIDENARKDLTLVYDVVEKSVRSAPEN